MIVRWRADADAVVVVEWAQTFVGVARQKEKDLRAAPHQAELED